MGKNKSTNSLLYHRDMTIKVRKRKRKRELTDLEIRVIQIMVFYLVILCASWFMWFGDRNLQSISESTADNPMTAPRKLVLAVDSIQAFLLTYCFQRITQRRIEIAKSKEEGLHFEERIVLCVVTCRALFDVFWYFGVSP